jgi:hypothetical protein
MPPIDVLETTPWSPLFPDGRLMIIIIMVSLVPNLDFPTTHPLC